MSSNYALPTLYQQQIHKSKYARWMDDMARREHYDESIDRYLDAMVRKADDQGYTLSEDERDFLRTSMMEAPTPKGGSLGSMRALMTAGPALDRDNVAGYNCAYLTVSRKEAFDEAMFILMNGTGVGFSVERQYVQKLPEVPEELFEVDDTIVVADSKRGWASAYRRFISSLYDGSIPKVDVSRVRPEGARLKTFGGRASGPGPLLALIQYTTETFLAARGRKLTSLECHGIMCKVGDVVVVGGVRRSALISLSNPSDDRMRDAKTGQWWDDHPEYRLANNSAAWTERPSMERFMDEWSALIKSKSGERGFVNRAGMKKQVASIGRRDSDHDFGTNPCSEIILRDRQFCNLSEVVARAGDTEGSLKRKVEAATILGCIQSCFTNFRYLSAAWKRNCEEERLLGVSITGIMDNGYLSGRKCSSGDLKALLKRLKQVAIDTAKKWAKKLGINVPTAITCVKPSGTVSQLVDAASGIHPRYAPYYVRTNRASKLDSVAQFLQWSEIPHEEDLMNASDLVFSYPIKAPKGAVTRNDVTALDQLRLWLVYAENWCEHKPSITVYVREEEWLTVGAFVFEHFDRMSGVSFLPHSDHTYQQAPYTDISEEEYNLLTAAMPDSLTWDAMAGFESEDTTSGSQELACVAGACEVV